MAFIFGDIHGCKTALQTLWQRIQPTSDQEIIFLGDYIDRGKDSCGVIDFLINVQKDFPHARFIMGNHEEMFLSCRYGGEYWSSWMTYGGEQTLLSYGLDPIETKDLANTPAAHWNFLSRLLPYYENEHFIFTHACPNMNKSLSQQDVDELRWWGNLSADTHCSGKRVVFGHMSQPTGLQKKLGRNLCIDTSISGWISCFDSESNTIHQANQDGEYRKHTVSVVEWGIE